MYFHRWVSPFPIFPSFRHPDLPSACPGFGDSLAASLGDSVGQWNARVSDGSMGHTSELPDLPGWSWLVTGVIFQGFQLWDVMGQKSLLSKHEGPSVAASSDWKWPECGGPICASILGPLNILHCRMMKELNSIEFLPLKAKNPKCCGQAMPVGQAMPNWDSPGPARPSIGHSPHAVFKDWGPHKINQVQFGSPNLSKKSVACPQCDAMWPNVIP